MAVNREDRARAAAFGYIRQLMETGGGLVRRKELEGFEFEGQRVALVGQSGIRKPAAFLSALSIMTVYAEHPDRRPYEDALDGTLLLYKWRGTDPMHSDNVAMRRAMEARVPLVWFRGVAPGVFVPLLPVWIVDEEPENHRVVVDLEDAVVSEIDADVPRLRADPVRRYAQVVIQQRLHQRVFRGSVLVAYQRQCALCRLRHPELLDAAHIKSDRDGGEPIIPNGIAMCAIHHRAFDANLLGIRPDYRIAIRSDVRDEADGPTLRYALQGLHEEPIALPARRADRPRPDLVEERYERFRAAG